MKDLEKQRNLLSYLFSKIWRYSEGNRKKVFSCWCMFIVANSISLVFHPLIFAKLINIIQAQGITVANLGTLIGYLSLTLILDVVFWSLHGSARLLERANAFKARVNYRKFLLRGVMTLPLEWHTEHHSGDTIDKIEKGTGALYDFSQESYTIIYAFVQLAVSFTVLTYFSRLAGCVALVMILINIWINTRFDRVLLKQYHELNHAENNVSESVFDAISNISTVIILRVERLVFNAIINKVEKPYGLFVRKNRITEIKWCLTSFLCTIMTIIALTLYCWQNLGAKQGILIGSIYLLINYLEKISELFFKFAGMYNDIVIYRSKIANSEELAEDFRQENFMNHLLPKKWHSLEIKDLNFSYNGDELNLENLRVSVGKRERIALVGESGSGKTTLLRVMRDLYHPENLTLLVDGKPVPNGFGDISRAIALVPQDPEIFATTILENITLGAEYDIGLVKHFTDMACFTEVVENLPKKFDSSIKEKGVNLSGGQQQRLALVRGLLACHDKDIILLDEPTSSVDVNNEMRIYENIFREFGEKAIISSVHRLHLLPLFEKIYFFKGGRIIGSGTLSSLVASCPEFGELWQKYNKH